VYARSARKTALGCRKEWSEQGAKANDSDIINDKGLVQDEQQQDTVKPTMGWLEGCKVKMPWMLKRLTAYHSE
jgi:hypothetical protein